MSNKTPDEVVMFRVWDGERMHYPKIITFDYRRVSFQPGGLVSYPLENVERYLGRNDKNNIPIYEGDVVKTCWQHDGFTNFDYELIGITKYIEEDFAFSLVCTDQTIRFISSYGQEELIDIEVIGSEKINLNFEREEEKNGNILG